MKMKTTNSVSNSSDNQDFELTLIHGLVKKCYGCDKEYTDMDRQSPFDLVIRHEEVRPCFDRVTKRWYIPYANNVKCILPS